MKLTSALILALSAASFAPAQTSVSDTPATSAAADLKVRHVIGLDATKRNATGKLAIRGGELVFGTGKDGRDMPISSIEDVFIGTEVTQAGGKKGRIVKTAAMAAPYETGRSLSILMRTKVDILTISYHDAEGGGTVLFLPSRSARPNRCVRD